MPPLSEEDRASLVAYLDVTPDQLYDRTRRDKTGAARVPSGKYKDAAAALAEAWLELGETAGGDRVDDFIRGKLARKEKIPGFGHRVYTTEDPRATHLRQMSKELGVRSGQPHWFQMSQRIEALVKAEKKLNPNVDFYAASVYHALGIPTEYVDEMRRSGCHVAFFRPLAANVFHRANNRLHRRILVVDGRVGIRPMIDLNSYYVLALNRDSSISVVDPMVGMAGKTYLYAHIPLPKPGADWAKTARHTESGPYGAEAWLTIYADHLENHARQIENNVAAWQKTQR